MQALLAPPLTAEPLTPPLKWAGGKRWLVPQLQKFWKGNERRRLVEPFMGALAVSLAFQPRLALLNDANPHLVNFYRQLAQGLRVTVPFRNDTATFYGYRARFNELVRSGQSATAEAAQLFYYLNRTGFNGLCRFNKSGEFNVPMGRYNNIDYETTASFARYEAALSGWEIMDPGDFARLKVTPGDFVYADPPYDAAFTAYDKGGFTWDDQERLAKWLGNLGCPVVASNHATDRVIEAYQSRGFVVHVLPAPRRISCTGDRSDALEILAVKGLPCNRVVGPASRTESCPSCGLTLRGKHV